MTELLQVEHLSKQYPGFTLQDISFSVKPGRIMGLIGKNGAGKSTTLKSILNMVRPESGTVTMLGKDFYANEKECKQDIGVVFGGIAGILFFLSFVMGFQRPCRVALVLLKP